MNAKDLALGKINAGPKVFGLYAYGISLGMSIIDLANIINTPQGRAITKICEGNVINGQNGAFSALQAIKKLEGKNILSDLIQFDIPAIELTSNDNKRKIKSGIVVNEKQRKTASELVQVLIEEYYLNKIKNNKKLVNQISYKPNTRINNNVNFSTSLSNMLYLIGAIGKIDECLDYIFNKGKFWKEAQSHFLELENSVEWKASIYQLLEYCKLYGDLVNVYYQRKDGHYYARDLKILAEGAEEMRVLGTLLSSNKGVKSRAEESLEFIKTIENAIIDRKEIKGIKSSSFDRIDFVLFCLDENYRKKVIEEYELVKHSINILDVIANSPHFFSYIRTCCIPYAGFRVGSSKFRARYAYYDEIVDALKIKKSEDKNKAITGIENAVNYRMFQQWLHDKDLRFFLPAGSNMFVGRNKQPVTTTTDLYIPLFDKEGSGLATFKYYMEHTIIPKLKSNANYTNNAFVQGLIQFELTKTGTHAAVPAYTLFGDMIPLLDSDIMRLLNYQASFLDLYSIDFPADSFVNNYNTIPSYADAFYIYAQYVFNGKKGSRSLMSMFDDGESMLANQYLQYEAEIDLTSDFKFDLLELAKWCAPNSNVYHPSAEYFYAPLADRYSREFQKKVNKSKKKKSSEENDIDDVADDIMNEIIDESETSKKPDKESTTELAEPPLDFEQRMNYIHPSIGELTMGKNIFDLGKNTSTIEDVLLINQPLDPNNPDVTYSVIANDGGEFHFVINGQITERDLKIAEYVNKAMSLVCYPVLNIFDKTYVNKVDPVLFKGLLEESINEVDKNC